MSETERQDMSETRLVAFATFPKDQRFTYAIEPLPGRMLNIETVGGTLVHLSKALKAAAKEVGPEKRIFALAGIRLSETGRFEADIVELIVEPQERKRKKPA